MQPQVDWQSRAHFFPLCARQMRRILTDQARARRSDKRGGGAQSVSHTPGISYVVGDLKSVFGPQYSARALTDESRTLFLESLDASAAAAELLKGVR